jgi:hypothetical protein
VISAEELSKFRELVENQSLRSVRRNLDYDKRVKSGEGLAEFRQWLGKILLDDGTVYGTEEKALAFEVGACDSIGLQWADLRQATPEAVTIAGPLDKTVLYFMILAESQSWQRRAACAQLFAERYRKHWKWIQQSASELAAGGQDVEKNAMFYRCMEAVNDSGGILVGGDGETGASAVDRYREELEAKTAELARMEQDLEFAEDRARRAHQRIKTMDGEHKQLRTRLRAEKENGEKLREERSRRIKLERQTAEGGRDFERLKSEYLKLDQRLRSMAARATAAEQSARTSQSFDLGAIRNYPPGQILGIDGPVSEQELSQVRRRFAAVFHPDRVEQLPAWVGTVLEELLGIINEACDRTQGNG